MPARILFVEGNLDGTVGGSYFILLDLVLRLDRSRYEPIVVFRDENRVAEQMRDAGVRVLVIPAYEPLVFDSPHLNRWLAPLKKGVNFVRGGLGQVLAVRRLLTRERIDLVNFNNSVTISHEWMAAAFSMGIPCITHQMGIPLRYSVVSRVFARRQDAVICLSHAIFDAMRESGLDLPRAEVIYSAFDPSRYSFRDDAPTLRERHDIPPNAPVIGVIGNIKEWKGQETAIRAMGLLASSHPDLRCILVGATAQSDQPYRERLDRLCVELDLRDRVIFAGSQDNPIDYMRLMDVVMHTSTSPEPFGIVLLEAMLVAKPLISTTIGGPAEIVDDGVTGHLVEPGRPEALAEAVDRCLRDPAGAAAMGARSKERLFDKFAIERTVLATTDRYDRVLAARAGR
jgi:glycosyltransferase involved in cell wall biosynthesis